jgi:hypothetical protein
VPYGIQNIHLLKPGNLDEDPDSGFHVHDNGDGSFTMTGTDTAVSMISSTRFQLNAPTVDDNSNGSYTATSG